MQFGWQKLYATLGFQVTADDSRMKAALNVFFQDFIDTLELREGAKRTSQTKQKPTAKSD